MRRKPTDRDILRSIPLLLGHDNFESLRDAMIQFAGQLFDADIVAYTQFDATVGEELNLGSDGAANRVAQRHPGSNVTFHEWSDEAANRVSQRLIPVFEQVIDTHPLVPYGPVSPDAPSKRISNVPGGAKFGETAFSREYLRHFGVKYQMIIPLEITPTFHSGVTLNNSVADFTARDCELANLVRPQMHEAFRLVLLQEQLRGALAKQRAMLDQMGFGQMDVAFDGRILNEPPAARQALLQFFPTRQVHGSVIPSAIHEWLLSRLDVNLDAKPIDQQSSFRLANADGELSVTLLSVQYESQRSSLLVSYSERFDPIKRLHRNGLTRREAEVLNCLRGGGTNRQIAAQLHISPGTVRTHVERILSKLGVATRTAAVRLAEESLNRTGDFS